MPVPLALAIHGGPPAVTLDQTHANCWPILTEEDEQAVLRVLRDGELCPVARAADLPAGQRGAAGAVRSRVPQGARVG
ncbi:MAG: hypothetical protein WD118_11720 [Phycisphaeraceae bacterium]